MVINYGTIIDTVVMEKYNKVFVITDKDGIYSLIEHHLPTDTTDIILRVSDLQYVEFKLKERINMINEIERMIDKDE